ncbi:DUF4349 domain-containing protein [archaeon]|nr:DUF4349 domain-containing protein [archaeon]
MNLLKLGILLSVFLAMSGCADMVSQSASESQVAGAYDDSYDGSFGAGIETGVALSSRGDSFADLIDSGERILIKRGSASVEVDSGKLDEKLAALKELISQNNGSIENIGYRETESSKSYDIEVRIPPTKFESISLGLQTIGTLKSLSTNSEDVTFEYIDLESKIKNLEAQKTRLLAIYDRAETIESIVQIEVEVSRTQTQIDSATSRKNFLERQVARATLNIRLYEEAPIVDRSLLIPLNQASNTLIAALGAGILIISGLVGFLIPFAVAIGILILILKALKKYLFKNMKIPFIDKKK